MLNHKTVAAAWTVFAELTVPKDASAAAGDVMRMCFYSGAFAYARMLAEAAASGNLNATVAALNTEIDQWRKEVSER